MAEWKGARDMENEKISFSQYFDSRSRRPQEVVLPLHDESLSLLTELARADGVSGTTEYMRSIALQRSLDRFTEIMRIRGGDTVQAQLHLSAGQLKDRSLFLFSDTLVELGNIERKFCCSETILLETAIKQSAQDHGIVPV
jgi:hypothetical protein